MRIEPGRRAHRTSARAALRWLLAGLLVATVVLAAAEPASAHAELESTAPASGGALDVAPDEVTLHFSEAVEVGLGAVRVVDGAGRDVPVAPPGRDDGGTTVRARLPDLEAGAYVVAWQVVSADSHPIRGAFTFTVGGAAAAAPGLVERLLAEQGGSTSVGAALAVARALLFGGIALLVGSVLFLAWWWPDGAGSVAARRLVAAAWGAAVLGTLAGLAGQGPYATGGGLGDAADLSTLRAVLDTRFGQAALARLVVLALVAPLLVWARAGGAPVLGSRAWRAAALALGVALIATVSVAGHAATGPAVLLALPADVVHVAAAGAWLGGLAVLALALRDPARGGVPAASAPTVAAGFSLTATVAVGALALTGVAQGWRQLGGLDALGNTTYGRVLVAKVAVVAAMVLLGARNRRAVRSPDVGGGAPGRLRRRVLGEVGLGLVVVALTAVLVNAVPGRELGEEPFSATIASAEGATLSVTVDPAGRTGNEVHLIVTPSAEQGLDLVVEEATLTLSAPGRDVAGIDVPLSRAGDRHFVAYDLAFPFSGTWQLEATTRFDQFTNARFETTLDVR